MNGRKILVRVSSGSGSPIAGFIRGRGHSGTWGDGTAGPRRKDGAPLFPTQLKEKKNRLATHGFGIFKSTELPKMPRDQSCRPSHRFLKILSSVAALLVMTVTVVFFFRLSIAESWVEKFIARQVGIDARLKLSDLGFHHADFAVQLPGLDIECSQASVRWRTFQFEDVTAECAELRVAAERFKETHLEMELKAGSPALKLRVRGESVSRSARFEARITTPDRSAKPLALEGELKASIQREEFSAQGELKGKGTFDAGTVTINGQLTALQVEIPKKTQSFLASALVAAPLHFKFARNILPSGDDRVFLELDALQVRLSPRVGKSFPISIDTATLHRESGQSPLGEWSVNLSRVNVQGGWPMAPLVNIGVNADIPRVSGHVTHVGKLFSLQVEGNASLSGTDVKLNWRLPLEFIPDLIQPQDFLPLSSIAPSLGEKLKAVRGTLLLEGMLNHQADEEGRLHWRAPTHLTARHFGFTFGAIKIDDLQFHVGTDALSAMRDWALISWPVTEVKIGHLGPESPLAFSEIVFRLGKERSRLGISDLRGVWAGGKLESDRLDFDLTTLTGFGELRLTDLDLNKLLNLDPEEESGPIQDAAGKLSGKIPLSVESGKILIQGAELHSTGPGLVRLRSKLDSFVGDGPVDTLEEFQDLIGRGNDKLALKALENFQYTELGVRLDSDSRSGTRLIFDMTGSNPALIPSSRVPGVGAPFQFKNCSYHTPFDLNEILTAALEGEEDLLQTRSRKGIPSP